MNTNILNLIKENGQSITEYSVLFITIAIVLIFAINGPIKDSLNETFEGVFYAVGNSVNGLIP
ncbi:MAG: hypothetical protein ABIA97_04195 [Candidatus Omnitrophota bacterium]